MSNNYATIYSEKNYTSMPTGIVRFFASSVLLLIICLGKVAANEEPKPNEKINPLSVAGFAASIAPDVLEGQYKDEKLTIDVSRLKSSLQNEKKLYEGTIKIVDATYEYTAHANDTTMSGEFRAGTSMFPFKATVAGDALYLSTGDANYVLMRVSLENADVETNPLSSSAVDQPQAKPSFATPNNKNSTAFADVVLAKSDTHSFTMDAATAYSEALYFALAAVNRTDVSEQLPQQSIIELLANEFQSLDLRTQSALSDSRSIWTEAQLGWDTFSQEDQMDFVAGVLAVAGFDMQELLSENQAPPETQVQNAASRNNAPSTVSANTASSSSSSSTFSEPCYTCSEEYSRTYSGGTATGDGTYETFNYSSGSYDYD